MSYINIRAMALIGAAAMALSSCSVPFGGDNNSDDPKEQTEGEVQEGTANPSLKEGEVGAISDVEGFDCTQQDGVWSARFNVNNKGGAADYRFVVNVTEAGGKLIGSKETKVDVGEGETKEVVVEAIPVDEGVDAAAEGIKCFTGAYRKEDTGNAVESEPEAVEGASEPAEGEDAPEAAGEQSKEESRGLNNNAESQEEIESEPQEEGEDQGEPEASEEGA